MEEFQFIIIALLFLPNILTVFAENCTPIYVRWPRVRLIFRPKVEGPYSIKACQMACSNEEHPARSGYPLSCAGYNHKQGPSTYGNDCQIYQGDQLQNVDGYAEADDRYSFYWKYCVQTEKLCNSDYQFTFFTDRYMDRSEVARITFTKTLEECLGKCLDENLFTCRSVSFNRTDGGCHMSPQNQLSKPRYIRLNNNPNFRIDYYESNCYNSSFKFEHECRDDGILVKVSSKFPYTGVLYGLYDYFTCRLEPKEQRQFTYFFPTPAVSRNCTDSIRYKDGDMILEVVLSTDGVEPLYFITPEDLTYQARCPNIDGNKVGASVDIIPTVEKSNRASALIDRSGYSHKTPTTTRTTPLKKVYTLTPYLSIDARPKLITRNHSRSGTKISVLLGLPDELKEKTRRGQRTTTTSTPTRRTRPSTTRPSRKSTTARKTTVSPYTTSTSTASTRRATLPRRNTKPTRTTERPSSLSRYRHTFSYSKWTPPPELPSTTRIISPVISYREKNTQVPRLPPRRWTTTTKRATTTTTKATTTPRPTTPIRTTTSTTTTTTTATTIPTTTASTTVTDIQTTTDQENGTTTAPQKPILFDIFHRGQPVQAVVVGSRVTLSFTPFYAIPPSYMTIAGCQVEPVGSLYDWERDPLPIVKDGCQADHVGLVCPPERTDFGIRVEAEAFRYQTTAQVQYTCLIRVCPFAPCPQPFCPPVEGCSGNTLVTNRGTRQKRQLTLPELRKVLSTNPTLFQSGQLNLPQAPLGVTRPPAPLQNFLVALAGDHVVKKRLIVVNSENELQYYLRTGSVPNGNFP